MAIDKEAIKEHIRGILVALGDDPNREGLKETPDRVAKMYEEVFEGMNYSNHEIACKKNQIAGRLIPVPKEITAGCGMAWMTPLENEESVVQFMSEHEIIPQGVFQVEI